MNYSRPVRRSDLAQREILKRIHAGELPLGSKLPSEPELAEQLGVSRGILREALISLQSKGYISRTPRGGSFIERTEDTNIGQSITAQVQTAELRDLVELREAIECKTVKYIIDRASDEDILALYDLLDHPQQEHKSIDYYFHYRLAELSGNRLFVVLIDMYYDTIKRYALGSYRNPNRKILVRKEHLRIVKALENRNKRAAVVAIRVHLSNLLRRASED